MTEQKRHFKVVDYRLENVMFIRELALTPEGNLVIFTGENDQGKGSSMKGLPFILGGAKFEPEKPGRDEGKGQMNYVASVTLEDHKEAIRLIATRTTSGGLKVRIEPPSKTWGRPQQMLDDVISKLGFNPMRFIQAGATPKVRLEAQREMLKEAHVLEENFEALEERIEEIEGKGQRKGERAQAKDRAREKWAQAAAIMVQPDLPKDKIDIEALKRRRQEIREHNRKVAERIAERAALAVALGNAERAESDNAEFIQKISDEIVWTEADIQARGPFAGQAAEIRDALDGLTDKVHRLTNGGELSFAIEQAHTRAVRYIADNAEAIDNLKKQAEQKRRALAAAEQQAGRLSEELAQARMALDHTPALEREDDEAIDREIDAAEITNREIDRRARREGLEAEAKAAEAERDALDEEARRIKQRINDAYVNAKMPMEGLTFTAEGARYFHKGAHVLLEDLGEALQIKIGMHVALASNPGLRLVMIPNGEALDKKNKLEIAKLAQELDCEVWMSCVDFTEEDEDRMAAEAPMTVAHIEDGRAKRISKRRPAKAENRGEEKEGK